MLSRREEGRAEGAAGARFQSPDAPTHTHPALPAPVALILCPFLQEASTNYVLKCNIDTTVNHLHDGIALGLRDDREKHSEALGRTALFKGSSALTRLPPFVTVQLVRFFYKVDTQSKAKVLRKVRAQG